MESIRSGLWIALAALAVVHVLTLRLSVRLLARGAENAWDNAIAYALLTGLLLWFPARWMIESGSFLLALAAPLVVVAGQLTGLRTLYELPRGRAALLGLSHGALAWTISTLMAVGAGVVLTWWLYDKIVSDPLEALRMLLRWLGVPVPF